MNVAYNRDCMEAMRKMPDNAFDLAVVDPPYGGGFTEGGGCQGWFSKYHQEVEKTGNRELGVHFNGRGRSRKYQETYSQPVNVEREREQSRHIIVSEAQDQGLKSTSVTRTGGTWAEKYGKK